MNAGRSLNRAHLLAVGVNAIIGSSIFLIPGKLSANLGWWSVPFFGMVGFLLHWVAKTFAILGKDVDRNGGPYTYASLAFNRNVAFGIGWLGFICATLGSSTVGAALVYYFNFFCDFFGWAHLSNFQANLVIATLLVFFTILNYRGALLGANAVALMAALKTIPLIILLGGVMWFLSKNGIAPFESKITPAIFDLNWQAISASAIMVMFAFQGFEVVPVIAGEAKNPKRDIPWATQNSLWMCAVIYMLVQSAVMFSKSAYGSETPIIAASNEFFGKYGSLLVALAGMYSIIGYLAGSPLYGPRYLTPLSEDGFLPKYFAKKHPKFGTPYVAIVLTTMGILFGCFYEGFDALLSISALTVALQYLCTSIALCKMDPRASSRIIGMISAAVSFCFILLVPYRDYIVVGLVMCVGFLIYGLYSQNLAKRPTTVTEPSPASDL